MSLGIGETLSPLALDGLRRGDRREPSPRARAARRSGKRRGAEFPWGEETREPYGTSNNGGITKNNLNQ